MKRNEFGSLQLAGAEHGDVRQWAAHHGDFVARVEAWAGLAVLVDLVGERGAVGDAEAEVEEEVGDAGEEADADDALVLGFFQKRAEELAAGTLAFGFGFDDDGADLGEVGAVEVQGSAAEKDASFGFGDLEVADVLADLCVVAAKKGAVSGEGVDELEDVDRVLEFGLADGCATYAGA